MAVGLRYDWQNYGADYHNFAPRFAFAYTPWKAHRTVLRGGAGIFYDMGPSRAIAATLLLAGSRLDRIQLLDPNYANPRSGAAPGAFPPNIPRLRPTLTAPYTRQCRFWHKRR